MWKRWWYHDSVQGSRLISETVDEVSFFASSLSSRFLSQKTAPVGFQMERAGGSYCNDQIPLRLPTLQIFCALCDQW